MNDKKDHYNIICLDEIKNEKINNTNIINKKLFNKNSIRKQKRLFQMQKRLALLNEEELYEIESDNNRKHNQEYDLINNLKSFQKISAIKKNQNKMKLNRNSLSFNCSSNLKDNINKDVNINLIKQKTNIDKENEILEHSSHKKNKIIEEKKEKDKESQNKEEELSIKKKNTNSNTNDDDKSISDVIFSNEVEQNIKKNICQNDFNYLYDIKKDNEDINDDPNAFSRNNEMNKLNHVMGHKEKKNFKDFISVHLTDLTNSHENFLNNFELCNNINDTNELININKTDGNEKNENENSVIIHEDDICNINYNDGDNDEENVELNISNLEIDINQINNDDNCGQNEDETAMSGSNSNEFAKKYLSSKSKSFIKFNNNLKGRVAAQSSKNSPSYILALCPELLENPDKKNAIKNNYAVTDAISEEMESDTFTPRQTEKFNEYSVAQNAIQNKSINMKDYYINKTLRNKDVVGFWNFEIKNEEKEKNDKNEKIISKKFKKKSKANQINKINKNKIKDIKDIDIELKNINITNKKIINVKSYSNSINNKKNISNNKTNKNNDNKNEVCRNGILKHSEKKSTNKDNLKIQIKHRKTKSLINNSQINQLINGNCNNINHTPKQVNFELMSSQNSSKKIVMKNIGYRKKIFREKFEIENLRYQQKQYLSNDNYTNNNHQSVKKNYNKNNSNGILITNHKLCKSDKRIKKVDFKLNYNNLKKSNMQILSKSNQYKNNSLFSDENNNNKICHTEKANKSKKFNSFISHIKKNTPINIKNMTDQNINHSKKLSQKILDGYKLFVNSLNNNNTHHNYKKEINKINLGLNNFNIIKTNPLNNYFNFNKNRKNNKSSNNYNNSVTFYKKNNESKDGKKFHLLSIHNKSKTSFISPSYQNINKNKIIAKNFSLMNSKSKSKNKNNDKYHKKIKNNYSRKKNNKFNEIKKILKDTSVKIVHKKINTIGNSKDLMKIINNNGLNNQLKGSASNNNLKKNFNKHKIIMALQHIKFLQIENYSKALNELYKSKTNLFIILIYTDSLQRYIFRGLYEVNSTDQKTASKLFAPGFSQNIIKINSLNYFFNYKSNSGEFVKTKFYNENNKKFNSDTIVVY